MSKLLTLLLMIGCLILAFGDTTSDAQVYRNDGVPAGLPAGIELTDNVYSFKLPGGAVYAPMVVGFLSPPQVEPTLPVQHKAVWPFCEGPANAVRCGWRFNYFGNILETSLGEWDTQ